jgi:CubicO group peptidase (beta-lactamase class C family)
MRVDPGRRAVEVGVGAEDGLPIMRAVFREGFGCVVMSPNQTLGDAEGLPELRLPPVEGDSASLDWPEGDRLQTRPLAAGVDRQRLEAAERWVFDRVGHGGHAGQATLSLLVVHKGSMVLERYAEGVDFRTRFRTWSAAKNMLNALVGIAVTQGKLKLDGPLPITWPPDEFKELESRYKNASQWFGIASWPIAGLGPGSDPRRRITLRHVLNMSSGLYPVDDQDQGQGSQLVYFGGVSAESAAERGLVREPGTVWNYENYDSLLALLALKSALGSQPALFAFPRRELFDKIGMRTTLPGVDRFGNFILSSQVYSNARDLARLAPVSRSWGVEGATRPG